MVIVTKNQYILANKIHHITLDEHKEVLEYRKSGKWHSEIINKFTITLYYTPDNGATNNNFNDVRECSVYISDKYDAKSIYKDLISQIREQMPDQLYLDKAFENLLKQEDDVKIQADKLINKTSELGRIYDRKPAKVRKLRKKKRRS